MGGWAHPACVRPQASFLTFPSPCGKNNTSGPGVVMMMVVVVTIAVVIAGNQIVDDIGGELMLGSAPRAHGRDLELRSTGALDTFRAHLQLRKKCSGLASTATASQGFLQLPHKPFFTCSLHLACSSSSPLELSGEQGLGWVQVRPQVSFSPVCLSLSSEPFRIFWLLLIPRVTLAG